MEIEERPSNFYLPLVASDVELLKGNKPVNSWEAEGNQRREKKKNPKQQQLGRSLRDDVQVEGSQWISGTHSALSGQCCESLELAQKKVQVSFQ